MIRLESLLENVNIEEAPPNVQEINEALQILINNNAQAVAYHPLKVFMVQNIGVLEINRNGDAVFTVPLHPHADLYSKFESNVPIEVHVGAEQVFNNETLVMINSQYSNKEVKFFLNPNQLPERITLSYKAVVCNAELRRRIGTAEQLASGSLVYSQGVVRRVVPNV